MTDQQVVVIGAGQAGLAAGAELRRAGLPALLLEKADAVGSAWGGATTACG
jgi:putative flavoprotein involved in K+ transport